MLQPVLMPIRFGLFLLSWIALEIMTMREANAIF